MKIAIAALLAVPSCMAFVPATSSSSRQAATHLAANIRDPTDKAETLRFGWDGSTALGGAVEVAKPARMLSDIRESGEAITEECEVRKSRNAYPVLVVRLVLLPTLTRLFFVWWRSFVRRPLVVPFFSRNSFSTPTWKWTAVTLCLPMSWT